MTIDAVQVVSDGDADDFKMALMVALVKMQDEGYEVEVQYGPTDVGMGVRHHALLLGRKSGPCV